MKAAFKGFKVATGKTIGYLIGLLTLPIIAFILLQLILLLFVLWLDDLKAVAFLIQFPASLFIWTGGKR